MEYLVALMDRRDLFVVANLVTLSWLGNSTLMERRDTYFDFPTCVGWVRRGTWDRKDGCAVVLSNAGPGWKRMYIGELHKGEVWTDVVYSPLLFSWVDDSLGGMMGE